MGLLQWALVALAVSLVVGGLGMTRGTSSARRVATGVSGFFLILALIMLVMVVMGVETSSNP